ncbi:MAG: type II secretion system protein GspG [Phycisphaerales bacterium JB041]
MSQVHRAYRRDPSGKRDHRCARTGRAIRRGMTLVEVLAVVVILGLLAATLAVGFSGAFGKGKQELARAGIGQIVQRLETYYMDQSAWPDLDTGLRALTDATPTRAYYLPPDSLLDPWDRPFVYITPGPDGHPYEVVTYGADGRLGGENENADLSSVGLRGSR